MNTPAYFTMSFHTILIFIAKIYFTSLEEKMHYIATNMFLFSLECLGNRILLSQTNIVTLQYNIWA
jgi:hypothetical protein